MKKVEAPTLEEAYAKASKVLECSISELQCEVVQHPSKGLLGLFKKTAIIVAVRKHDAEVKTAAPAAIEEETETLPEVSEEEIVASEIVDAVKEEVHNEEADKENPIESVPEKDAVLDSFFESDAEAEISHEEDRKSVV